MLQANQVDPTAFRATSKLAQLLEQCKPIDQPSRMKCWFLCDSVVQVKRSSGSIKYIYEVEPTTPVFKHYYGWIALAESSIKTVSASLWKADGMNQPLGQYFDQALAEMIQSGDLKQMLINYWLGAPLDEKLVAAQMPPQGLRLVEYTTQAIIVVKSAK